MVTHESQSISRCRAWNRSSDATKAQPAAVAMRDLTEDNARPAASARHISAKSFALMATWRSTLEGDGFLGAMGPPLEPKGPRMKKNGSPFNIDDPAYQRLRQRYAERLDRFVIWVGAGPSTDAGIAAWKELRNRLHVAAEQKAMSLAPEDRERMLGTLASIQGIKSPWHAFDRLQTELGTTTFREEIRSALNVPETVVTPAVYRKFWTMNVDGVLTTNLDRLVARSFAESRQSVANEVSGFDIAKYASVLLKSGRPFIVNLHGVVNEASSWVLTQRQSMRF
jgi:hypothetical protein